MRKEFNRNEIKNELIKYFSEEPRRGVIVKMFAWGYGVHSCKITPIFNELVKEGYIRKDTKSIVGNNIYCTAPRLVK